MRNSLARGSAAIAVGLASVALTACGGGEDSEEVSQSTQAAATSLQEAMDSSARAMDRVDGNRNSLDQLASSLQPAISQTSDVIVLMTPKAEGGGVEKQLLTAARQQRTFLQFSLDAAKARSRKSANATLERVRGAGTRAADSYSAVARQEPDLAGRVPATTTFNTGRLEDAVRAATKPKRKKTTTTTTTTTVSPPSSGTSSCGNGLSVNSVTSCPFAESVRDAWESSGGSSVIEAYSPVTGELYTMTCSGGAPVVCSGGNNARVYIR